MSTEGETSSREPLLDAAAAASKSHGAMLASAPMHRNQLRVRWLGVCVCVCVCVCARAHRHSPRLAATDQRTMRAQFLRSFAWHLLEVTIRTIIRLRRWVRYGSGGGGLACRSCPASSSCCYPRAVCAQLQTFMAPESDDTFNYNYNLLYSVYSFPNTVSGARAWAPVRRGGGAGAAPLMLLKRSCPSSAATCRTSSACDGWQSCLLRLSRSARCVCGGYSRAHRLAPVDAIPPASRSSSSRSAHKCASTRPSRSRGL
jgi:hypothetical protein